MTPSRHASDRWAAEHGDSGPRSGGRPAIGTTTPGRAGAGWRDPSSEGRAGRASRERRAVGRSGGRLGSGDVSIGGRYRTADAATRSRLVGHSQAPGPRGGSSSALEGSGRTPGRGRSTNLSRGAGWQSRDDGGQDVGPSGFARKASVSPAERGSVRRERRLSPPGASPTRIPPPAGLSAPGGPSPAGYGSGYGPHTGPRGGAPSRLPLAGHHSTAYGSTDNLREGAKWQDPAGTDPAEPAWEEPPMDRHPAKPRRVRTRAVVGRSPLDVLS